MKTRSATARCFARLSVRKGPPLFFIWLYVAVEILSAAYTSFTVHSVASEILVLDVALAHGAGFEKSFRGRFLAPGEDVTHERVM
jgi:hypothetical protein